MTNNNRFLTILAALVGVLLVAVAAALTLIQLPDSAEATEPQTETIAIEIAEDMTQFVFNQDIVFEDGMPSHGSGFVTKGYIYPAGTISEKDGIYNGVNPDGSAEFPDKVLGEWVCYGYMIDDAMHAESGAIVVSKQYINFNGEQGAQMIVSEGYERIDDKWTTRAITGGTGDYLGATGIQRQRFLGVNVGEGFMLEAKLTVQQ